MRLWPVWHNRGKAKETTMDWDEPTDDERLIAEQAVAIAGAAKLGGGGRHG